jgi:hypothetical protein
MLHRRVLYFGTLCRTRAYPHKTCRALHRCALHGLFGARCMLHRCTSLVAFCIVARVACCLFHVASLHVASPLVCMLHRHGLHVASVSHVWHVASVRVASARVASARVACCMLHRICARCTLHRRRAAVMQRTRSVMRCIVCCAWAVCDWAKAGVHGSRAVARCTWCAGLRRRAHHDDGHRAVRHRGDIRHRSKGSCGAGRRCEPGRMHTWGGGRRTGCGADCGERGCAGFAQDYSGGVVRMGDGTVTFKGGSISNSTAVRAPSASCAPRAVAWYVARCGTADRWRARCGSRMLRRVVYGVRRMRPERLVCARLSNRLPKGQPHRDAECCTAAHARRALHDAPALVVHRVARLPIGRMHASRHM